MTTTALQSEEALLGRIRKQQLIESIDHMSPIYLEGMKRILTVSADTELISAPAYYHAAVHAPSLNAFGSAISIIQDELGHAHIAYRLLRDLGVDTDKLIFEREPLNFKYPYAFDIPLDSWVELIVANAFYDRAGYTLLGDVYQSTTFGPWKRALVKVDKEETFHLRHGEQGMRKLNQDSAGHESLQKAVDWMFLLTVEWFGLPDDLKKHGDSLNMALKVIATTNCARYGCQPRYHCATSYNSMFRLITTKLRKNMWSIVLSPPILTPKPSTGCSRMALAPGTT